MKHMNEFGDFRFLKLIFLRVVESAEMGILLNLIFLIPRATHLKPTKITWLSWLNRTIDCMGCKDNV